MKNYVERYIYAVTKRLPENQKIEVKAELEANIYDMLSEHPTDDEIESVLVKLGHPRVLASNYLETKHYVISPVFYTDYLNTLKIVLIIIFCIQVILGAIDSVLHLEQNGLFSQFFEVFFKSIGQGIGGLFTGFAWVTIIFWIVDRNLSQTKNSGKWNLKDLPDVPKPSIKKISRVETLIGLVFHVVFSAVFIAVLLNYLDYFVIEIDGAFITEIFNTDKIKPFVPFFIGSAILGVIVSLLKLYYAEWKLNLAILYTTYEILSVSLLVMFIQTSGLIKLGVYEAIAAHTDYSFEQVIDGFSKGILAVTSVVVIVLIIDLTFTWIKTIKNIK